MCQRHHTVFQGSGNAGKIFENVGKTLDLVPGFAQRLTLLPREPCGQVIHMFPDILRRFKKDLTAVSRGHRCPVLESILRGICGTSHVVCAAGRHAVDHFTGCGVLDFIGPGGCGVSLLAVDQHLHSRRYIHALIHESVGQTGPP